MNSLFHFSEDGRSCLITSPELPRHWYNYLWNEEGYCVQISEMGSGKSYYIDEQADMNRINRDSARYIYLRDDGTGDFWNPGAGPSIQEVTDYCCEHSINYSRIQSRRNGIFSGWELTVPEHGTHELWRLKVKNESNVTRQISTFAVVNFELEGFAYPRYYEMYRCLETSYHADWNGIFCKGSHPFAPNNRYNGFLCSSLIPAGHDSDLAAFAGCSQTLTEEDCSATALFTAPLTIARGENCHGTDAALFIVGGVLQHRLTLAPGEEQTILYAYGCCSGEAEAAKIAKELGESEGVKPTGREDSSFRAGMGSAAAENADKASDAAAGDAYDRALAGITAHNADKYRYLAMRTPDARINALMNDWVKRQVDFCIVGKKGVRDNLQIAVALLNYRPEKARKEILECLRHQFRDGHTVLTWYPYDDTRYSDQPFWIIWAVVALIKETGDYSILGERLAWQDGGEGTVMEHLLAAVQCLVGDKGPHGLVKMWFADWNDALNVTTDPDAESVMLSEQTCMALRDLAELVEKAVQAGFLTDETICPAQSVSAETARDAVSDHGTANPGLLTRPRQEYRILAGAINAEAWDGEWYVRALYTERDENGNVTGTGRIGSKESRGSKIYLNAQTWALLADIVPEERKALVLKAVDGLERDFGFPLNDPPYMSYEPETGRMSGMLPGLFENGGVYCHASAFKMFMDCHEGGRAVEAVRTMKKLMPDSEFNPSSRSGAEPYVFTNCYSTHPLYYGRSYQSWTTGTSAWCLRGMCEGILGVRRDYEGLRIQPSFPADWDSAEITRQFRGAAYHVVICNPDHLAQADVRITVDGHQIKGNLLPDYHDGRTHEVTVRLV
jgi:cellobiose phosphorylase